MNKVKTNSDGKMHSLYHVLQSCYNKQLSTEDSFQNVVDFISEFSSNPSVHQFYLDRSYESGFVDQENYSKLSQLIDKNSDNAIVNKNNLIKSSLVSVAKNNSIPQAKFEKIVSDDETRIITDNDLTSLVSTSSKDAEDEAELSSLISAEKKETFSSNDITRLAPRDNVNVDSENRSEINTNIGAESTHHFTHDDNSLLDIAKLENSESDITTLKEKTSAETSADVTLGLIIKNRFILEENIGSGGMGTVYKARDLIKEEMNDFSSEIAIKVLNEDLRDREDALISLQREAVKSQILAHPNILTVYDFDRDGDLVYMSMEYLKGNTLEEVIREKLLKNIPVKKTLHFIELIARGLAYAHKKGFAHADLKPGNIILTDDGNVKVLDFGIAQAIRGANDHTPIRDDHFNSMTIGGVTPNYASPEMLDDKTPTPADDIYALGCVAYTLLAGTHPFVDEYGNKVTSQKARDAGLTISKIPKLPRRQMHAIQKCLEFNRSNRFQNAGEFLDAFKPPAKLKKWVLVVFSILTLSAIASWWVTLEQSTIAVNLNDLPEEMSEFVRTIKLADERFKVGDVDQSHKLYAQVWEASFDSGNFDQRDQLKLKVILDRRINAIIEFLLDEATKSNNSEFRLLQLQVALEFLKQGDLGTIDDEIAKTLQMLEKKINTLQ